MGRKTDTLLKGFIAAKCLTLLNLTTARIKVSRNRKSIAVRQMRGEIAQLLKSGQATHVYDTKISSLLREENRVAAYDLIDHFCHSIISQFPVIETQRYCPTNLKEPIASLIYAAARCAEIPELTQVKDMLTTKYGKEFAVAADEIRPECGVSRQIIELLSMRPTSEQMRVKLMKEICLQNNIAWRSEWTLGDSSMKPPSDFLDTSIPTAGARVDIRRVARDEGSIKSQLAETQSSSIRSSNPDQDIKVHAYRGSRHGEVRHGEVNSFGPKSGDEATTHHISSPVFGPTPGSFPKGENARANIKVSEGIDESYRHASLGFGPESSSHPKEELPRADIRVSEGMDEPYNPGFGLKRSSLPKEGVTRANMRVSDGMDEPYNPGFGPKCGSLPKEDFTRANMRVSEGINEPTRPTGASFGSYKVADYKQEVLEDRAEHHDEMSDSGSEVFVSVEDDEVALSRKEAASRTSNATKSSFQGNTEDHSSNSSRRAPSLRASVETSLSREGSLKSDSLRASGPNPLNEEDEFASTAKAIAAEAARLAVLDYARRYSRSGSIPMDLGDLIDEGLESMKEKIVYSKTKVSEGDDGGDRNIESRRDSTQERFNRPLKKAADHNNDDINRMDNRWDGAANDMFSSERQAIRRAGEKPQFNYESQDDSMNVKMRSDETSAPTYGHERNKYNVHGKNAESPHFDQAAYKQHLVSEEKSEPYNAHGSMPEKRPVSDDSYKESPYRNEFSQEPSDQIRQHQSSSRFKEANNSYIEDEPSRQHTTREDSDEDKQYAKDRDWDASTAGYSNHNIRARPRQQQETDGNVRHEETTAEEDTVRRRQARSPVERSKQKQEAIEKDSLLREETRVEKVQGGTPSAANSHGNGYNMSRRSGRSRQQQEVALEEDNPKEAKGEWNSSLPGAKEGQGHAMSKRTHQRSEKNTLEEVLSAKWHGGDVYVKVENMQSYESPPSLFGGTEGGHAIQNKSHEPARRNKPLAQDSDMGKRIPSRQGHRERERDLLSAYTPHGQVHDLGKRVPSSSTSVRQQQQSCQEDVQATASGYKPHVQPDSMGRRIGPLQKQELRQEEQKDPSRHHEEDRQHRQGKYEGEQDSLPEKEYPRYHKEHQKPTSFTSDRRKPSDAASMSPKHVNEPHIREPPPLPQSIASTEAGWAQQHPLSQDQWKRMSLPEEVGAYELNDSAKLERRSQPPTRPPPRVTASTVRATERESLAKLDKESQAPTRPAPAATPTRWTSSPLAASKSDPVILASKPPSLSLSSSSSAPAASPTKLGTSKSGDAPATATPRVPPKLPHVDDIAANLEALKQARQRRA